jgi:hypothetical protein
MWIAYSIPEVTNVAIIRLQCRKSTWNRCVKVEYTQPYKSDNENHYHINRGSQHEQSNKEAIIITTNGMDAGAGTCTFGLRF